MKTKTLFLLLILLLLLLTGCRSFESESVVCQALFENGSFEFDLNETGADSCEDYSYALYSTGVCKAYVDHETVNNTCILTWTGV